MGAISSAGGDWPFTPDYLTANGQPWVAETLAEELAERGWTPLDLVERGQLDPIEVGALLAGEAAVTAESAAGLSRAFGTSDTFWLRLGRMVPRERVR